MSTKISSNILKIHQSVSNAQLSETGGFATEIGLGLETSQKMSALASPIFTTSIGILGTGYGAYLTKQGIEETKQAVKCDDRRGIVIGSMNTGIGVTFAGASLAAGADGVVTALPLLNPAFADQAISASNILLTARDWLGLSLYAMYIGGAVAALPDLHAFRTELKQVLNDQPGTCPKAKALGYVRFLQQQIGLTEEETAQLSGLSPELVQKKVLNKWNLFIRRVGIESANKVAQSLPLLLRGVTEQNLGEINALMESIDKGNFKSIVAQISLLAAGILGMIGTIFTMFAVGTYASVAMLVTASVLYWANGVIGDLLYKLMNSSTDKPVIGYNTVNAIV